MWETGPAPGPNPRSLGECRLGQHGAAPPSHLPAAPPNGAAMQLRTTPGSRGLAQSTAVREAGLRRRPAQAGWGLLGSPTRPGACTRQ